MRRHPQQRSLPLILLFCVVALTFGCLLLLPFPVVSNSKLHPLITMMPEYVSFSTDTQQFSTPSATLISTSSFSSYTRTPSPFEQMQEYFSPKTTLPRSPFDQKLVELWVNQIAASLEKEPILPIIELSTNLKSIQVNPGQYGVHVDRGNSVSKFLTMDISSTTSAKLIVKQVGKQLTPDAIFETHHFAQKLLGKTLLIQAPHYNKTLSTKDIVGLLEPPTDISDESVEKLSESINNQIGTMPVEPVLEVNGQNVSQFIAPKDGQQINSAQFGFDLREKIRQLADSASVEPLILTFQITHPKTPISQVNSLGISERIGIGESEYAHSIPNRVKNVSLTTSKIHAKIVMPGEEFSFNKYLGEVSAQTGFLPAYVIKEGQTVLGDGGGVCQVSSTLFRAVLNTGLPITERRGHSYRVGYYEENSKPGFDATVYSPHPDFRFTNDTDTPILINAVANPKTLSMYIELWGKLDGRSAAITNYKQWDAQPAPPPIYQDDPTLPPGKLKQIDFAAPGLKTSFDYVVTYPNGSVKTKSFATNYIPWRAVYLRGI